MPCECFGSAKAMPVSACDVTQVGQACSFIYRIVMIWAGANMIYACVAHEIRMTAIETYANTMMDILCLTM